MISIYEWEDIQDLNFVLRQLNLEFSSGTAKYRKSSGRVSIKVRPHNINQELPKKLYRNSGVRLQFAQELTSQTPPIDSSKGC